MDLLDVDILSGERGLQRLEEWLLMVKVVDMTGL